MLHKYQYADNQERENLILTNNALILVEEQNIAEGNFLIFVDSLSDLAPRPTPIEQQLSALMASNAELKDDNLILIDIMLTTYEDMLAKGTV